MIVSGLWHKKTGNYAPQSNTANQRSFRYGLVTKGLLFVGAALSDTSMFVLTSRRRSSR